MSERRASMIRVASTPALTAPWTTAAESAARFARTMRPLPSLFRTPMVAHELSPRMPAPARLTSLVSSLRGRLAVVNLPRTTRLPGGLTTAVRGLVRIACDPSAIPASDGWEAVALDSSARRFSRSTRESDARLSYERRMTRALASALALPAHEPFTDAATWVALALYESASPTIRLAAPGPAGTAAGSSVAVASAEIDYRLVMVIGSGTPGEWDALDAASMAAPATAWPRRRRPRQAPDAEDSGARNRPWFSARLLVPDTWFSAWADAETLAAWARLTGRSGAPDRYWFPETWDRFLEPGRRVGWLTASDVWRPRRGQLSSGSRTAGEEVGFAHHPPLALTRDVERGVGLPPGYALVECIGRLSVAVVRAAA